MKNKRIRLPVRLILVSAMTLFCTALFADDDDSDSDRRAKMLTEYRVVGFRPGDGLQNQRELCGVTEGQLVRALRDSFIILDIMK